MEEKWKNMLLNYSRNDVPFFRATIELFLGEALQIQNDEDIISNYASVSLGVAATLRQTSGIDIGAVDKLGATDSKKLVSIFDRAIEIIIEWMASAPADDIRRPFAGVQLEQTFIWKGYVHALTTEPSLWDESAVGAMSYLRILSTATPSLVIDDLRKNALAFKAATFNSLDRSKLKDDDWPPTGFIKLYFRNRALLESKSHEMFGRFY